MFLFILGCIYCNKWQEAQVFEFVSGQKPKSIELKEKVEKTNLDVTSPADTSSLVTISNPENIINNNQNTVIDDYSDTDKHISENNIKKEPFEQERNTSSDICDTETNNPKAFGVKQSSKCATKKSKRKLGFLQMRIDSTIYFDNMGYSYQIQNEKNDKK